MQAANFIKNNYAILFLLIIASALRLFNIFHLEYTFDELSALNRIEYHSFSELISQGVKLDAHPALIQVFLYYYCKLFGTAEWVVKLPFILAGISSVYIIYLIAKKWFNETTGLLTATILTCAQYFVFYSVVARPYVSGLLLCLLSLKYWLDILFDDKVNKTHYLWFSIFVTLSALNHHFSMMFVALCAIIGLFFISKARLKNYIIACFGAIILYSPHFPILWYQLQVGGIGAASGGWLNPPENDFIIKFIKYVFHYSYAFGLIFITIIIWAHFKVKHHVSLLQYKIRFSLFALFLVSFLIGFFYSQKVNPVIQYSTLIFATPCLLLFAASFAGELNLKLKWIAMTGLLIVGIGTLVFKRKYYDLIFRQSFDTYIQTADQLILEKGNTNVYSLFKGEPWFLNFYKKKYQSQARFQVIENEAFGLMDYQALYDTLSSDYLILGDFTASQLLQASAYYPFVYQKIKGYGYELYVLSKKPTRDGLNREKQNIITTNFDNIPSCFNVNKDLIIAQGSKKAYQIDSLNEYPISYKVKNTDLHVKEGQTIVAEIKYHSDKPVKGLLCGSTDALKKNTHWASNNMEAFYKQTSTIQTAYLSIYVDAHFNNPENELTIFVWNNQKEHFLISDFSVYTWDNNPYRFGLLSDF